MGICEVIVAVLVAVLVVAWIVKMVLANLGKEKVELKNISEGGFLLESKTEDTMVISKTIGFVNEGKQCATIMDAFFRPQLPYEQYDGVAVRGYAELEGAPREDDYFEAVLIQKNNDSINIKVKLSLTARKGMSLKEAVADLPDFTAQLIWLETGRTPCHYRQARIGILADEIRGFSQQENL